MLNKRLNTIAAFFAALLFSGASHAGVIYNWDTVSNSPTISSVTGQIEITEAAWLSGNVDAMYNNFSTEDSAFPDSPLLNFEVAVNGKDLRIVPRDPTNNSFGDEFILDVSLEFDRANPASGSIVANNSESEILFGGNPLWEIGRFGSDDLETAGEACFNAPGCSGALGLWQIDGSTIPDPRVTVAEPPAWLLSLAALALIFGFASRRNAI